MKNVSILIPCYNEENNIQLIYQAICEVINKNKKYR